jgi:hypothetical protein
MRKNIFVALLVVSLVALLLVGCGKTEQQPVQPIQQEPPVQGPVVEQQPVEIQEAPEQQVVTAPERPPMKKEMKKILDKVHAVLPEEENYEYLYTDPIGGDQADQIFVKGDKMRVEIYDDPERPLGWKFDTVYLDKTTKTAVGYCAKRYGSCPAGRGPFEADYNKYIRRTPREWMQDFDYLTLVSSEQIESRITYIVEYEEGTHKYTMWLDAHTGYPIKILFSDGFKTDTYEFRLMYVGEVKDYDVKAP